MVAFSPLRWLIATESLASVPQRRPRGSGCPRRSGSPGGGWGHLAAGLAL